MAESSIKINFIGDTKSLQRSLGQVDKSLATTTGAVKRSAGSMVKDFARVAAPTAIAAGIAKIGADSIGLASDVKESLSKIDVVFGESAAEIKRWSQTAATSLGISRGEALATAGTFGNFFKTIGTGDSEASAMSQRLTGLASDLASFNNTDPSEVIEALGSALRGEAEPISKFGVLMNESTLKQEALAQGLIKTTKQALTPQQKAMAAYGLILKQTKTAQGDFAKTSGGVANQSRIMSAKWKDLQVTIGSFLMPVMVAFQTLLMGLFPVLSSLGGFLDRNKAVLIAIAAPLLAVGVALGVMAAATWVQTTATAALNAVLLANPLVLIAIAIAAVIAVLVLAYKRFGWFRAAVDATWQAIQVGWDLLLNAFSWAWENIGKPLFAVISTAISLWWNYYVKPIFTGIKTVFAGIWSGIKTVWNAVGVPIFDKIKEAAGIVGTTFTAMKDTVGDAFRGLVGVVKSVWNAIAKVWNSGPGAFSVSIPSWVPGIGGNSFDVPDLPVLHSGGTFRSPLGQSEGLALLRDREVVLTPEQVRSGRSGGNTYNINVTTLDARTAGTVVIDALKTYERTHGKGWRN